MRYGNITWDQSYTRDELSKRKNKIENTVVPSTVPVGKKKLRNERKDRFVTHYMNGSEKEIRSKTSKTLRVEFLLESERYGAYIPKG